MREGEKVEAGMTVAVNEEAGVDECRPLWDGCSPSSCWRYNSFKLGRAADEDVDERPEEVLAAEGREGVTLETADD